MNWLMVHIRSHLSHQDDSLTVKIADGGILGQLILKSNKALKRIRASTYKGVDYE